METNVIILLSVGGISLLVFVFWFLPFFFARYTAVRYRKSELDLFGGWVKLILWQPNEGVIVLRNKRVHFSDMSGRGGIKNIFPIKGDELRARVPLSIRFLTWENDNVLTRESLQVHMKVVVWWRVSDIAKYIFDIDRSIHEGEEHVDIGIVESSEAWLKAITESTIRVLVSRASIAQLISAAATKYLQVDHHSDDVKLSDNESVSAIAETVANKLHEELDRKVSGYGISINRVEIQEIRPSLEVQEAINKVWIAFLKPVQTEQEARARQIELEAEAKVLGTDGVTLNEILKNFRNTDFYFIPPFLQSLFGMVNDRTQKLAIPEKSARLTQHDDKKLIEGVDGDINK